MITRDAQWLLDQHEKGHLVADSPSVPLGVFMVEPLDFRVDQESATDNAYMNISQQADSDKALEQYINLVSLIREAGVPVKSFAGDPGTPDDVFPNNAFATIPGRLIIGRMLHPTRQLETQRQDIRRYFTDGGYELVDLSSRDFVAELTGPLILDRARQIGFCGMTGRVTDEGVKAMHQAFKLRNTLQFDLADGEYHTNVVLSVLASRACVVHEESIRDPSVAQVLTALYRGRVLFLSQAEKKAFAGNCIALTTNDLFMSQRAADALRPSSRQLLESWAFRIHSTRLDEIEKAGGSLRCMVAEIY